MKYLGLTGILLLSSLMVGAQKKQGQARLDSLLGALPMMRADTNGVKLLDNIAYAYATSRPQEGLEYARRSLNLARSIKWRKGEANALNDFGNIYSHQASYPKALDYFFQSLKINEELGDKEETGSVSGNIGSVYFNQQHYSKALEYFFKSLNAAKETGSRVNELNATGNIGNVYYEQGSYRLALAYMQQALQIAKELDDQRGIINQLTNMGNVYAALNENERALVAYADALQIATQAGDRQIIASNEGNMGEVYFSIATDTGSHIAPDARMANLRKAVTYLQKGIAGSREVHFNQAVIEFSQKLSEAYTLLGMHQEALQAYRQYTALKDSVFNLENNANIAGLETRRALELKDKDIRIARLAIAKKRNERWFFIAGITFLLIMIGLLFKNFRKQQKSNVLLSHEKKRSDDLLLNILPAAVAAELMETGSAQAQQFEEVSVLFTDFVDFTGAAQRLTPQELVQDLHECFTAFDAIIQRNGLEKIKTIGDAYMAVCGLPQSNAEHAQKAVKAALEIRDYTAARRSKNAVFEIRIGINSGTVIAGIVGVKKFAYDIWGDTVNTAARMEQNSAPGAINISQSTYELVKHEYPCTYRGRIAAKHKGEIDMYFVGMPASDNGVFVAG